MPVCRLGQYSGHQRPAVAKVKSFQHFKKSFIISATGYISRNNFTPNFVASEGPYGNIVLSLDLCTLTRARPGGGYQPPLRFFADSEKTVARSAVKFAIAVQPTI